MSLVEMLVNNLLGRMVDLDMTVRMLCIRGLGNISSAGPAQVNLWHCKNVLYVGMVWYGIEGFNVPLDTS